MTGIVMLLSNDRPHAVLNGTSLLAIVRRCQAFSNRRPFCYRISKEQYAYIVITLLLYNSLRNFTTFFRTSVILFWVKVQQQQDEDLEKLKAVVETL